MCLLRFGFYCFYPYCVLYFGALLRVSVCFMLCLSAVLTNKDSQLAGCYRVIESEHWATVVCVLVPLTRLTTASIPARQEMKQEQSTVNTTLSSTCTVHTPLRRFITARRSCKAPYMIVTVCPSVCHASEHPALLKCLNPLSRFLGLVTPPSYVIFRSSPVRWPNKPDENVRPSVRTYLAYVRPYVHNQTQCSHKPNSGIC